MGKHYTKGYIENVTGMTFEEFVKLIQLHAGEQSIDMSLINNGLVSDDAIHWALNQDTLSDAQNQDLLALVATELEEEQEPAAGEDDVTAPKAQDDGVLDVLNDTHEDNSTTPAQQTATTQDAPANNVHHNSNTPNLDLGRAGFENTMVDSHTLKENFGTTLTSNALDATNITYNAHSFTAPKISHIITAPDVIEDINTAPNARYDIFFGRTNTDISGNLITDNGYGADSDSDSAILSAVAGTFATDNGGTLTLAENGDFTYSPSAGASGVDTFTYSIQDGQGAIDTAETTFVLSARDKLTTIDFSTATVTGYGGSQNSSNLHTIQDGGDTINIQNNTWKDVSLSHTITADTVLSFDFMSTARGEIHAIGFDTNESIAPALSFKLYGTQNWGITDFNNYAGHEGQWVHYEINVGDYYTGNYNKIFFVNDDDANLHSNSIFSNISIFEQGTAASETVTGTSASQSLYGNGGDDVIYGLDGDDVLYGGSGIDFLYGGNGADTFVFDDITDIDHVQDFSIAEGDALDISSLLSGYDPLTDAINDFVHITSDGQDTFLAVDSNGGGDSFVDVAILHGITGLDSVDDLQTAGNLVAV